MAQSKLQFYAAAKAASRAAKKIDKKAAASKRVKCAAKAAFAESGSKRKAYRSCMTDKPILRNKGKRS